MKRTGLLCYALLVFLLWAREPSALEVRPTVVKLAVHADQVRLRAILVRIADRGVKVRLVAEIKRIIPIIALKIIIY